MDHTKKIIKNNLDEKGKVLNIQEPGKIIK